MQNYNNKSSDKKIDFGSGVSSGVEDPRRNQKTLASRIQKLRKQMGLTQKQLAKDVGVEKNTIQNWEYGKNLPGGYNLKKLSEILGCTTEYLLSGRELIAGEVVRSDYNESQGFAEPSNNYELHGGYKTRTIEEMFGVSEDSALSNAVRMLLKIFDSQDDFLIHTITINLKVLCNTINQKQREEDAVRKADGIRQQFENIKQNIEDKKK